MQVLCVTLGTVKNFYDPFVHGTAIETGNNYFSLLTFTGIMTSPVVSCLINHDTFFIFFFFLNGKNLAHGQEIVWYSMSSNQ